MTSAAGIQELDVRDLAPPEPLDRILAALPGVGPGECLRVRHRREPWLLFPLLEDAGWSWHLQPDGDGFELLLWRTLDTAAATAAAAHRR